MEEQQNINSSSKAQEVDDVPASKESLEDGGIDKKPNLRLQIPPRSLDDLCGKPPLSPLSAKSSKFSSRAATSRPSFKSRVSTPPPASTSSRFSPPPGETSVEKLQVSPNASFSLHKIFNPGARRTSSLPVTPVGEASATIASREDEEQGGAPAAPVHEAMSTKLLAVKFERSLSVPLKKPRKNTGILLVKPATPPADFCKGSPGVSSPESGGGDDHQGQEIPADQAVCRICMDELGEGGNTFKMECCCKGELALAHEECTLKWFRIKGNKTCDVCGTEVQNLPVMLLRLSSDAAASQSTRLSRLQGRLWQDVPVLVMISVLSYFCLLEQLLVKDFGSGALVIALPFAFVLGILASITASTLVSRKFIWGYAFLQFALVILFAHVFYNVMPRVLQVHVEAVLAILLSAFAGFGIAMGVNGIWLEYSNWHRSRSTVQRSGTSSPDAHEQAGYQAQGPDLELGEVIHG